MAVTRDGSGSTIGGGSSAGSSSPPGRRTGRSAQVARRGRRRGSPRRDTPKSSSSAGVPGAAARSSRQTGPWPCRDRPVVVRSGRRRGCGAPRPSGARSSAGAARCRRARSVSGGASSSSVCIDSRGRAVVEQTRLRALGRRARRRRARHRAAASCAGRTGPCPVRLQPSGRPPVPSDLEELVLLAGQRLVDLVDVLVGDLLELLLGPVELVGGDLALLLGMPRGACGRRGARCAPPPGRPRPCASRPSRTPCGAPR